jgi:hypothetical protein
MSKLIDLPPAYKTTYFGDITSIIWVEVSDNNGPFSLEFRIDTAVNYTQSVKVINRDNQGALVWMKNYEKSTIPDRIIDNVVVWHNPQVNSESYSIQTEVI